MNDIIAQILAKYGVEAVNVAPAQSGYRNKAYRVRSQDGRELNLILYKSDPDMLSRIRNANRVAGRAAAGGLPVRQLADPRVLRVRGGSRPKYAAIYYYLPGATISWEAYTRRHLKALGAMLSRLHVALLDLPAGRLPHASDEYLRLMNMADRYFGRADVQLAAKEKLGLFIGERRFERYRRLLDICRELSGAQALHMDFVRGNVLFRGAEISGVIDFEKTVFGPRVFDVARTLAFLLVDSKYKDERHVRKFFLESGYNRRGSMVFRRPVARAGGRELDILEELVDMFLLYDLYKFLRHNPYDYLEQNVHFVRTRDLLGRRGVVKVRTPIAA